MTAALQLVPRQARKRGVLAQRKGGAGAASTVVAASTPVSSRPLDGGVRQRMERGFGRDFGAVRVHDHPAAHQSAREAGALAYTSGNDIVFAAGRYQPNTPAGDALLAHELAHTIQQAGVRAKADGPLPDSADRALEAEADRAAAAVAAGGVAPPLTRVMAPAVQLATTDTPPPGAPAPAPPQPTTAAPTTTAPTAGATAAPPQPAPPVATSATSTTPAGPPVNLPAGMTLIEEAPSGPGATTVRVSVASFTLPQPKGAGAWVQQAYDTAAKGGRLVFSPLISGNKVAAWKEGTEDYQSIWVKNIGFESLRALGDAIGKSTDQKVKDAMADAGVAKAVHGMTAKGLKGSGFDIDHIVEKQLGGTSIPSNLQLLESAKNQASGRETYQRMVGLVEELRQPAYRPKALAIQIVFGQITVPGGSQTDASFLIETLLRSGAVKGSDELIAGAKGTPVLLTAGGQGETVRVTEAPSEIEGGARRVIPGMKLVTYRRKKGGAAAKPAVDEVAAELDSRAISKSGAATAAVPLAATKDTAPPGVSASVGGKAASEDAAALTAGETRVLKFATKPKSIAFFYPYLSAGELTKFDLGGDGSFTAEGVIHPTLKFLPDVHVRYGPNLFEAVAPLDPAKFKSPIPLIQFTGGELKLELNDGFKPSGEVRFTIGPAGRPIMNGKVNASAPGGVFTATGELTPAATIPGIKDAKGEVTYNANAGWSGKLTASSSKLPNTTVSVVLSFMEEGGRFVTRADGGLVTTIRDKSLTLNAAWAASGLVYTGGLDWPKPFPIVDNVHLRGRYAADLLELEGGTKFRFKQWEGDVTVRYRQKDGEAGKLSGTGKVKVETKNKKAAGELQVAIDDAGELTGQGEVTYQLTEKIAPKLGVTLARHGHLTIRGEVRIGDIELFKKWPEKGGEKTLMSLNPSFKIPTPIPAVNAAINIHAGVGISYHIGPGKITGVVIAGQFDPLEENPNVTASLSGKFVIPTGFGLTGDVSAKIGVEVAGGAVGIDGGVGVRPAVELSADAVVDVAAKYDKGDFEFVGKAFIDTALTASLKVDLVASIYAAWHLLQYDWAYNVAALSYTFPEHLKINIGEVAYVGGQMRWPKLSDISIEPADISPLKMIQDIMEKRKTTDKPRAAA
jgi:hypothetical protein